jgi:hypothetical protein
MDGFALVEAEVGEEGGCAEDDGAFFLLPYWMGRYLELLVE